MIVVDASAAVSYLLNVQPEASRVRERITRPGETLHAPHLFDIEVLHAIRSLVLRGDLTAESAELAIADLHDLRLT